MSDGDDGDIEVAGHELWVPIPLDRDPGTVHAELLDRFGRDDATADQAAAVVGAGRQLVEANADADENRVLNLAAWALVSEPDALSVRGFATLRAAVLEPGSSLDDVVAALTAGETLFQEPVIRPIETRSGEATSVRARPMVDEAGGSQVHELAAVLWERPELQAWYLLSSYSTDLVDAHDIGELLEELGAGIEGL